MTALLFEPGAWRRRAACSGDVDPELWYSDYAKDQLRAVRICERCPVLEQCRAYVLEHRDAYGVWGGLTVKDRQALLGKLKAGRVA